MLKAAADLWRRLSDNGVQNLYQARAKRLYAAGRLEPVQSPEMLIQKLQATAAVQPVTAARIGVFLGPTAGGWTFHGDVGRDIRTWFVLHQIFAHIILETNGGEVKEIMLIRLKTTPKRAATGAHGGRAPEDDVVEKFPVPVRRYLWQQRSGSWSVETNVPWH